MSVQLQVLIMLLLQAKGIGGQTEHLYKRLGEDVILSCETNFSTHLCSKINWLHRRNPNSATKLVYGGNLERGSAGASRLSVSRNCSLLIRNITDEDAGIYTCHHKTKPDLSVDLNILGITSSLPDDNGIVTLQCSLSGYEVLCQQSSFFWKNKRGMVVFSKGVEFEFRGQKECLSFLAAKHPSKNNIRYTCILFTDNKEKINVIYQPPFTGISGETEHLHRRAGDDAILPCRANSSSSSCSDVNWVYSRDVDAAVELQVRRGKVDQSSARASRLSLSSNCSLLIRNINDKDAGEYTCWFKDKDEFDADIYLDILGNLSGHNFIIIVGAVMKVVLMFVGVVAALVYMYRRRTKENEDERTRTRRRTVDGISGETLHLFARAGDQVLLPYCANSSSRSFSEVNCLYQKDMNTAGNVVIRGEVVQSSAGASRLSVSRNSLLMRNISAEDAGLYVCIQSQCPAFIYLSILSISPSPPDLHGNVKLHCSLISIDDQVSCQRSSILWENETGNELIGEKAELEVGGRRNCDSVLTVKHTTENNRRFTCKFVEDDEVKIDAVYVLDFPDLSGHNFIIIVGAVMKVVLMFLGVVAALVYMYRRRTKENEDQRTTTRRTIEEDDEDAL
ncbi:uncharacterized protein LOC105357177 isoform X3 [Oryzias latipes]|uniref:uncharacterized protein LOC105357177 isoform X3 n=1 Tax=Oryzias latipes TaxID=8090 RepID=UPI000CE23966|nr:uncharacterized protein LOC105357177 isoform X3 [Oryzias latipes]